MPFGCKGASDNVFIGISAGTYTSDNSATAGLGSQNVFVGNKSGSVNSTGFDNSFFGKFSGYNNTTGSGNVYIGRGAGYSNSTGVGNVFIGYRAGKDETGSDKLYIENGPGSTPLIYGDFAADQVKINGTLEFVSAFATSDRRWKKSIKPLSGSLATIQQLNGVSYLWRRDEFPDKGFDDKRQVGLIA